MLGGAAQTPFDIHFSLFGIPVRVHPGFWIMSVILGGDLEQPHLLLLWVLVAFLSILVHELGHALTMEAFQWPAEIVLYHFGGYAQQHDFRRMTPWKDLLVSAAGPAAGLLLAAVSLGGIYLMLNAELSDDERYSLLNTALYYFFFFNLSINAFNLVPALPLDGGRILQALLRWFRFRNADKYTVYTSIAACLAVLTLGSRFGGMQFSLIFAMLLITNIQTAIDLRSRGY